MKIRRLILAGLAIITVGMAGGSWWVGSQLVQPVNHPVPRPANFAAESLRIPGANRSVAAWWLDRGEGTPAILLFHPVRADRSVMLSRARLFARHGFSVLLIDLQAHGETPGTAITFGWRESADVRAALAWLRRQSSSRRIGAVGCSLGGAALLLGPQPVGVDAAVLEAVYPRAGRAVENRIRLRLGSLAPVLTPLLVAQLQPRLGVSANDLEPIRGIGRLGAPVLVLAGAQDEHTTLEESRELFAAAREPKELWVVPGARHQDLLAYDPEGYEAVVLHFLNHHLRPAGALTPSTRFDRAAAAGAPGERGARGSPWPAASRRRTRRRCSRIALCLPHKWTLTPWLPLLVLAGGRRMGSPLPTST